MIVSVLEKNDAAAIGDRLHAIYHKASMMKNLNSKKNEKRVKKNKSSSYSRHAGDRDYKLSSENYQAPWSMMGNPTANAQQIGHHMAPSIRSPSKIVVKKRLSVSTKDHSQTKTRMKTMELSLERFRSNAKHNTSIISQICNSLIMQWVSL